MRRLPPLNLIEGTLEGVSVALLAVLEAHAPAHLYFKRLLIHPLRLLHRGADEMTLGVGADRLLHRVPGDVQPVQRMWVNYIDGAYRRALRLLNGGLLSRLTRHAPPLLRPFR